jgi:predicted transposase YbfD/YdcC
VFRQLLGAFSTAAESMGQPGSGPSARSRLAVAFLGAMMGRRGWPDLRVWKLYQADWLEEYLPELDEAPDADALSSSLSSLDPKSLFDIFPKLALTFFRRVTARQPGPRKLSEPIDAISFLGKTTVSEVDYAKLHTVNAVYELVTLAVGQARLGSADGAPYRKLIERLEKIDLFRGKLMVIDAMGCREDIAAQIRALDGHWLFALKSGKDGLSQEAAESVFGSSLSAACGLSAGRGGLVADEHQSSSNKTNGLITYKLIGVVDLSAPQAKERLAQLSGYEGAKSLFRVVVVSEKIKGDAPPKASTPRYYLSSLLLPAKETMEIIANHRRIEAGYKMVNSETNKPFYDDGRLSLSDAAGSEVLATMRKLALNFLIPIMRLHPEVSLRSLMAKTREKTGFLKAALTLKPQEVGDPMDLRPGFSRRGQ